jgi:hypothetical protein
MREIRMSGSMSGDGKLSVAAWPKLPRPSSTLPSRQRLMLCLLFSFGELQTWPPSGAKDPSRTAGARLATMRQAVNR